MMDDVLLSMAVDANLFAALDVARAFKDFILSTGSLT